jgi:diguanylate cyclase (GGDEF)-like protein/PAS domain S-box-containing protein
MTEGERLYQHMAAAARDGGPPPMEFLQWRAWTVPMLTNILAPRDAPVEQALEDIRSLRSSAQLRLGLMLVGGAIAILLFLGAGVEIERRVIKPLARLTKALDRAAETGARQAPSEGLAQYQGGNDELGALSRALGRFHQSSAELRRLHQRFDAALANLPQGLCVFDADRRLLVANSRYAEVYGLAPEQVAPGTSLETILWHREQAGSVPDRAAEYVHNMLEAGFRPRPEQIVTPLRNGRTIAVSMQPLPEGGWVATHEDVTARYEAEARIAFMANHDALTELPNRVLFRERMTQALSRVGRGEKAAALCLDLDQFKGVNDTLGHPAGDRLLRAVAQRLVGCMRASDTVARLGGDEFAILQVGAEQPDGASGLARRIIEVLGEPYDIDGQQVVVGTSIGVALAPADTMDPDELLKSADVALYRAKADGRGRFRFFERDMDARIQARRVLEVDLRKALSGGEFELFFQPFMNLERNEVSGFEALLRWNRPDRGIVLPEDFVAVAEEIGLIVPLGEWVLQQACTAAVTWPNQLSVAVNLSPAQFKSKALLGAVVNALASSGLPPSRLEVEITESVLLQDDEANVATLHQLRALGVRISLDDFGTGYSSLRYLRRFPFDKIKIDRSFVRELTSRGDCAAIVRAVASLGTALGMVTTAEGVETTEQLEQLRAEGCVEAQGYLFSRPKPGSDVVAMLEEAARRREPTLFHEASPGRDTKAA